MRVLTYFGVLASALHVSLAARSLQHVGKRSPERGMNAARSVPSFEPHYNAPQKRDAYLTNSTKKFVVNGNAIPDVDFDIGESYAGLLPISSDPAETRELYFWFFPSENALAGDEILIWLNGGPGCSSLEGLLQENGPFLWQYGTFKPYPNPYTWVNLTNVVWVEQPVGTGFSQGTPNATNEVEVAHQFLGFFKNFVETFALQGREVYIAGESYAGYYIPYIADAMLNTKDKTYYNLDSILMYDPSTSTDAVQLQIPMMAYVDYWSNVYSFNASYMDHLHTKDTRCGYTAFLEENLVYPPKGKLPSPPGHPDCDIWDDVYNAATLIQPCYDVYQILTTCPLLWDVLGFPGSIPYEPPGAFIYFNRTDVQKAINAPPTNWEECVNDVLVKDTSPPSGLSVLPGVIERANRTIIGHGLLDGLLLSNGTLLMIQNMTWSGKQGFQSAPAGKFFVPYHTDYNDEQTLAGAGVFGTTHTERGLTYCSVDLSGHMVPQYAPSAAYRQLEFLLGRIDSLTEMGSFTTQP
ncbi:hypothetical protein MMC13_000117 [Lambiella insularis]|nr:hypothetical protein [Lambiella insularis]